jgi:hypothetical protein
MGTNLIWLSAIALELVILYRGAKTALLRKYPLFYAYIACVLVLELLRVSCFQLAPNFYPAFYWYTEPLTIVSSYAVIFEIFKRPVIYNPAVARLAQPLLVVVFILTATYAASDLLNGGLPSLPRVTAELSRDLRCVEATLLVVMLWLFGRYRVSLGRNFLGLIVGYSLLIGLDVINLAFFFLPGSEFSIGLRKLFPITYIATLLAWCAALWSARPDPATQPDDGIERDYDFVVAKTKAASAHLSALVTRTLRP